MRTNMRPSTNQPVLPYLARKATPVVLLMLVGAYLALGNSLFDRVRGWFGNISRSMESAAERRQIRAEEQKLQTIREKLQELENHRVVLDEQIQTLDEQRTRVQARLKEQTELLETITHVLAGEVQTSTPVADTEAQHDSSIVLARIADGRATLQKCEETLEKLKANRTDLDEQIRIARAQLENQEDALLIRQAQQRAREAYHDSLHSIKSIRQQQPKPDPTTQNENR